MTNEQLAIFLESVLARLVLATESARRDIAATRPEHQEQVHTEPRCIGLLCQNGDHYTAQRVVDSVVELAPIDNLADWIEDSITTLCPKE